MKIEAGKFYKTRCGRKVKIYEIHRSQDEPIHGAIEDEDAWAIGEWSFSGQYLPNKEHPLDIISELEEPKPKLKAWINGNQNIVLMCEDRPNEQWVNDHWIRAEWLDQPEDEK